VLALARVGGSLDGGSVDSDLSILLRHYDLSEALHLASFDAADAEGDFDRLEFRVTLDDDVLIEQTFVDLEIARSFFEDLIFDLGPLASQRDPILAIHLGIEGLDGRFFTALALSVPEPSMRWPAIVALLVVQSRLALFRARGHA